MIARKLLNRARERRALATTALVTSVFPGADTVDYLRVEYGCSTLALESVILHHLAIGYIVGLAYILGQPAVHQIVGSAPKFFAPRPVLNL